MPHSYSSSLYHCTFSTKERVKSIAREFRYDLWAYMGGIARGNAMAALAVGGTDDHAHLLLSLPATLPVSKAVQIVKCTSSKWVNETYPSLGRFAWQEGYGAFSIGKSHVSATIAYIDAQEEHHRTRSFEDEFRAFLRRHGIAYDERYVWG